MSSTQPQTQTTTTSTFNPQNASKPRPISQSSISTIPDMSTDSANANAPDLTVPPYNPPGRIPTDELEDLDNERAPGETVRRRSIFDSEKLDRESSVRQREIDQFVRGYHSQAQARMQSQARERAAAAAARGGRGDVGYGFGFGSGNGNGPRVEQSGAGTMREAEAAKGLDADAYYADDDDAFVALPENAEDL
ncbi:hypothetical protein BDV18DRAFT_155433 [Aspergillus unguis]